MGNNFFNQEFLDILPDSEICELLKKYRAGDKNAYNTIIEHHFKLILIIIRKYFHTTEIEQEDLFDIGAFGLIKAIKNFDEKKGIKFATYATRVITNEILMALRKEKKHRAVYSYNIAFGKDNETEIIELFPSKQNIEHEYIEKQLIITLSKITANDASILTSQEKLVLNYLYGLNGYPRKLQSDIGAIINMTQSGVSRVIKRALIKVRNEISKYGYEINEHNQKKSRKSAVNVFESENGNNICKGDKVIPSSIYDILKPYSKIAINSAISKLRAEEQDLLRKCYGQDFSSLCIVDEILDKKEKNKLKIITKKILNLLQNKKEEPKEEKRTNEPKRPVDKVEENMTISEVFEENIIDTTSITIDENFIEMVNSLPFEKAMILSLKYGLSSNKTYSDEEISSILKVTKEHINLVIKDFFNNYQMINRGSL